MTQKRLFIALTSLLVLVSVVVFASLELRKVNEINTNTISSFKECQAAGYPIMESYPRQCRTSDGELFVEDIDNNNTSIGIINEIATIQTGAQIGKDYCPEGLYVEINIPIDKYEYDLTGTLKGVQLQMRTPDQGNESELTIVTDPSLIGQTARITGMYDPERAHCTALLCECDDFLVVHNISLDIQ